jgi:hypothetical protein
MKKCEVIFSRALRVRAKTTSQNWRSDLVRAWLIRESKTTGIASSFADFASEVSAHLLKYFIGAIKASQVFHGVAHEIMIKG